MSILLQFQNLLNSLDFSLQITVQSKKLDIRPYLDLLGERVESQSNELIKIQTREYIEFIRSFTESVSIMAKNFFVVIPYSPPLLQPQKGFLGKLMRARTAGEREIEEDLFRESRVQLDQRAAVVEQGLRSTGLRSARLGSEELIELFYKSFNPGETGKPVASDIIRV